jgi:hypothetical protein
MSKANGVIPIAPIRGENIADELMRAQSALSDWRTAIQALTEEREQPTAVRRAINLLKVEEEKAMQELSRLKNIKYVQASEVYNHGGEIE